MSNELLGCIAIVDDTEANRYTLAHHLKRAGYEVWEAATGIEGLELAKKGPDLIVLDVNLPDMNGHELSHMLKTGPATAAIPILQVSATYVTIESLVQSLESGADAYLAAPVDSRELLANVKALLRMSKAERKATALAARLQIILSSIAEVYFVLDGQGRFIEVNRFACENLFKRPESELLGAVYWELFPEAVPSALYEALHQAAAEQRIVHTEVQSKINSRWYEAHIHPRSELLDVYLRDITDRKRIAHALEQYAANLRVMVEAAQEPMLVVNGEGIIESSSEAAGILLEYEDGELTGKSIQDIGVPIPGLELALRLEDLRKNVPRPHVMTARVRTGGGGVLWVVVEASLVASQRHPEKYLVKFQRLSFEPKASRPGNDI